MRGIKGAAVAVLAGAVLGLAGCGSDCASGCVQDKDDKGSVRCGTYKCVKGTEKMCVSCTDFYKAPDPCADGVCTTAERAAYARLGNECAKNLGMIPISPKYGVPAVDCPVEFSVDTNSICPPGCSEVTGQENGQTAQAGFLMTAFDTPQGTRFVMVEADRDYDPKVDFSQVASDLSGVAQRLQTSSGTVAVYLTEFPLINSVQGQTSRQPKESEIELIRQSLAGMGKTSEQIKFVRWR